MTSKQSQQDNPWKILGLHGIGEQYYLPLNFLTAPLTIFASAESEKDTSKQRILSSTLCLSVRTQK
jgi:hypothetical protein